MKVAVVGLGQMGSAVTELLLERGHEVAVWNRSAEPRERLAGAGAVDCPDHAAVWREVDAAVTFLANDAAADAVLAAPDGLLAAAPEGALLIEMSTISPQASARIAETAAARGVLYVRAPVSGNPVVVRAGNLTAITSGPPDARAAAAPYLEAFTGKRFEVGDGDEARVVKLALNILIASTNQGLAEAIVLGEAHGVDRGALLEVVKGSSVSSPVRRLQVRAARPARLYADVLDHEPRQGPRADGRGRRGRRGRAAHDGRPARSGAGGGGPRPRRRRPLGGAAAAPGPRRRDAGHPGRQLAPPCSSVQL